MLHWKRQNSRILHNPGEAIVPLVSLGEIKLDSAPGHDGVKYSDLKTLNDSMLTGEEPAGRRDCSMAILPKPPKDHKKRKGYRIITMYNV